MSKNVGPAYFEPGMMEYLDKSEGLYDAESGDIILRFESRGTRYDGRTLNITDRVKTDNEKGYYIVDAIHEAMNGGVKLSFLYFDLDGKKKPVLKNDGQPYTVSPYDLIWDGDFYYLVGFCDERDEVRIFRVDRMQEQTILVEKPMRRRP